MEKRKRWQGFLILAVLFLTLYNILPTVFYYARPLRAPITEKRAESVSENIVSRVNQMEKEAVSWLHSFAKLLGIAPTSITPNTEFPGIIDVSFKTQKEADRFIRFLPNAGNLIPFVPAQMQPIRGENGDAKVQVIRNVMLTFNPNEVDQLFQFSEKWEGEGKEGQLYKSIVEDRFAELGFSIAGPSKQGVLLTALLESPDSNKGNEILYQLATDIVEIEKSFGSNSEIAKRFYQSFSQIDYPKKDELIDRFLQKLETAKADFTKEKEALEAKNQRKSEENALVDASIEQKIKLLDRQAKNLTQAAAIIKRNKEAFTKGKNPLSKEMIQKKIAQSEGRIDSKSRRQQIDLQGYNPLISWAAIEWDTSEIELGFYKDIQNIRLSEGKTEQEAYQKENLNHFVADELAKIARMTEETIVPRDDVYAIEVDHLTDTKSILAMDLGFVARKRAEETLNHLLISWVPENTDLVREEYPIVDWNSFKNLPVEEQNLGLVVYAPAMYKENPLKGFQNQSIYVIAKGLGAIAEKYDSTSTEKDPNTEKLLKDFQNLYSLLQQEGFIGYPGSLYGMSSSFANDYIFELNDYYSQLLKATREEFTVKGSKKFAVLDFSDVEQRILTENKISDRIQEDLIKWRDAYASAQVDLDATKHYTVPKPTKNVYVQNLLLSAKKYFRGDERKVLKWGLDLSGGKTVRIGLRDKNNKPVTDPEDLRQVVNELYKRVNQLGVAERTIRIENNNILLEFPGSQSLSAAELVKASSMYFHVVNEKFGKQNHDLRDPTNKFLQEVWNEAVVTNRKDVESINQIAWQHLGGKETFEAGPIARSESAQILYENGLRLADPRDREASSSFDDTLSTIAVNRGNESATWESPTHPLMIVFNNYALEGSNLDNIQAGYDQKVGNILYFGVKKSSSSGDKTNPREDLYTWTSQFAEENIIGTSKEEVSNKKGWRMAVVLNGTVVTAPQLSSALKDSAQITGRFSQREINQLAADLKAGSLSFTPKILSEENVSPELGKEERVKGIFASIVAIVLVVAAMVGYYRFAGLVASCAVLLNIFIMWGVLQNIGAAITLPGIAGIVLTIGMAVDANVLVFERIREEFIVSGRIVTAIQAGYRKAFSAIVDSNITTIIAAFILIQFDSGPIKGFAITLIIGILSSMFTALFMTRYFFAGWVKNPKNKTLTMANWIGNTQFNFLKHAKKAFVLSGLVIALGFYFLVQERNTILGMDFTGGYSLTTVLEEKQDPTDYRLGVMQALMDQGASRNDIEVRELTKPNQLRIRLGISMEEKGHPFYQMPERKEESRFAYDYQKDPRLSWIVTAMEQADYQIQPQELATLENNWTQMSGQFSDTMRNNAFIGLLLALACILIYITIRFEFKYAISSVIGLVHDIAITLAVLAIFRVFGFPVQIDLQVVGALMTIIGYSLNDTIIVFDRIREDIKIQRRMSFYEIINHSLNVTLSRTVMTSLTTLLVLLALVCLGGSSIFSFSLVMTLGVIFGTLSTLFIVCPVLLYFHNREEARQEKSISMKSL